MGSPVSSLNCDRQQIVKFRDALRFVTLVPVRHTLLPLPHTAKKEKHVNNLRDILLTDAGADPGI